MCPRIMSDATKSAIRSLDDIARRLCCLRALSYASLANGNSAIHIPITGSIIGSSRISKSVNHVENFDCHDSRSGSLSFSNSRYFSPMTFLYLYILDFLLDRRTESSLRDLGVVSVITILLNRKNVGTVRNLCTNY